MPEVISPEDLRDWTPGEELWAQQQPWLEAQGYMLRPRYYKINSATRLKDGEIVMLKRFSQERHRDELEITNFFSTEPFSSHPKNHCVQLYDVLRPPDDPDKIILVLPLLRNYINPTFQMFGEAVECFRQLFEGIQFMHECNVAHRFNPTNGPPRTLAIRGSDPSAPELQNPIGPVDPFPTDIYYLSNMIYMDFIDIRANSSLKNPTKRPTIDEVVERYATYVKDFRTGN
ncbi:hypothetical protein C8Q75DRAFT_892903 [Abortiporus biennis]|nr:hypothetical protein C8Q75DRAFT_892903 [Abortiporus biennis]